MSDKKVKLNNKVQLADTDTDRDQWTTNSPEMTTHNYCHSRITITITTSISTNNQQKA